MNSAIRMKHDGAPGGALLLPVSGRLLPFAFTVVSVAAVLALAGAARPAETKLLIFLVAGSIAGMAIRVLFRPLREHGEILATRGAAGPADTRDTAQTEADAGRYRLARWLYYLGTLTVTQTVWRKAGFTLSDWIFLGALGALVLERVPTGRVPATMPRMLLLGVGLLSAGGLLSSLSTRNPLISCFEMLKNLYTLGIWLWLGTVTLRTVDQVRIAVYCWLLSSAASGAAAIAEVFFGISAAVSAVVGGRALGLTEHVNELGMVEAMAFLPAVIMLSDSRGWLKRALGALLAVLITAGLVLSVSMGALAGLAIAAAIWAIGFLRPGIIKKPAVAVSILLIIAALGYALRFQSVHRIPTFVDRIQNLQEKSGSSYTVGTRIKTYKAAWQKISEDPFVGVGLDPQSSRVNQEWNVHNMLLLQWYEGGILSFLSIVVVFGTVWIIGWRTAGESVSSSEFRICIAMLFSFVAFFVFAMTAPEAHHRDAWMFAPLPLAMEALRRRRLAHGRSVRVREADS